MLVCGKVISTVPPRLFFFSRTRLLLFFPVALQLVIMSSKQAILISNAGCDKLSYYGFSYKLSIGIVNGLNTCTRKEHLASPLN